jgi:hypothetical protein
MCRLLCSELIEVRGYLYGRRERLADGRIRYSLLVLHERPLLTVEEAQEAFPKP